MRMLTRSKSLPFLVPTEMFGVPPLLDPLDIHEGADEKSLVTYMAGVIEAFKRPPPKPGAKQVVAPSVNGRQLSCVRASDRLCCGGYVETSLSI
jgi:hypothetical protein